MLTQAPTTQYTRTPFVTPDAPHLSGAWFDPLELRHALVLVGIAGTAHQSACYEFHPIWIETITAAGFRTLLLDYRGHGASASDKPTSAFRLSDYVQDVNRGLQAAGLAPQHTILFGHSLGAGVVLEVAAEAEEHAPFAGVIALGGVAASRWRGMYLRDMPGNFLRHPQACWRAMHNPQAFFLNPTLARQLLFQPSTPQEVVDQAIERTCPESGKVLTDLCFGSHTRPLHAKRALFLSGANDGCVPPAVAYQSARDYQALGCPTTFTLLPGAPHNLMMDGPVEEAARLVVQFAEACGEGD